jgi:CubicO group peptidase (beta-lactamase class C family)
MSLIEHGRLALDEDVNLHLKLWKVPESQFTGTEKVALRRFTSHTAPNPTTWTRYLVVLLNNCVPVRKQWYMRSPTDSPSYFFHSVRPHA